MREVLAVGLITLGACAGDPCEERGNICTVAGNGLQGARGDGGPATEAEMYNALDTVVTPDGTLWILDFNNYFLRAVDAEGTMYTVAGQGVVGDSPRPDEESCPAKEAALNHFTDLLVHEGHVYIAAWHNSRIKRIRLEDMRLMNYAGAGRRTYYDGDDGPALQASLDLPSGLAVDPAGNVVIMDQASQVVRRIDRDGVITRIAGSCVVEKFELCEPGEQPVACPGSNKTTCGDPVTNCSEECTAGYGGDGGPALLARLSVGAGQDTAPKGHIAYDSRGNLIIADSDNDRIRRVDTNGIITTIAGTGKVGYSGDGGPAVDAALSGPVDIEIGPDDTIYFTDVGNNCVRKIAPDGIISRVAGTCAPGFGDFGGDGGPALDAKLDRPYGVDLVGDKLYISDSYNNRVRMIRL